MNEIELLSNPLQFPSTYLKLTTPDQSIKALETMYNLSMSQTDVELDSDMRAF